MRIITRTTRPMMIGTPSPMPSPTPNPTESKLIKQDAHDENVKKIIK